MIKRSIAASLILLAFALAVPARAATFAYIHATVNLRAGPRVGYPVVVIIPAGTRVIVHGCLSDYSWCDVSFDGDRGWVYSSYVYYDYAGGYVPVYDYGPSLGIVIVSFSIFDYWGNHYRHHPWYRHRELYRSRFGPHGHEGRRVVPPPRHFRSTPPSHRPAPRREAPTRPAPSHRQYQERRSSMQQHQREVQRRQQAPRQTDRPRVRQQAPGRVQHGQQQSRGRARGNDDRRNQQGGGSRQ